MGGRCRVKNKVVVKKISLRQAIAIGEKFGLKLTEDSFVKFKHNEQVFWKLNEETGLKTVYLLQRRFFQKFNLTYSINHKTKTKKKNEIIISNCEMPPIGKYVRQK